LRKFSKMRDGDADVHGQHEYERAPGREGREGREGKKGREGRAGRAGRAGTGEALTLRSFAHTVRCTGGQLIRKHRLLAAAPSVAPMSFPSRATTCVE
jgi:hypothetical protein